MLLGARNNLTISRICAADYVDFNACRPLDPSNTEGRQSSFVLASWLLLVLTVQEDVLRMLREPP